MIHPGFNNSTLVHDIALLRLEKPAKRKQVRSLFHIIESDNENLRQAEMFKYAETLFRNEKHKTIFKNVISEKFRKKIVLFTCILPDYVFHESPKEFWKNSHFENMRAGFLKGVKAN